MSSSKQPNLSEGQEDLDNEHDERGSTEWSANGPFIVGGIGDSGTRGCWELLNALGINMLPKEWVKRETKDSIAWMNKERGSWMKEEGEIRAHLWTNNPDNVQLVRGPKELQEYWKFKVHHAKTGLDAFYLDGIKGSGSVDKVGSLVEWNKTHLNSQAGNPLFWQYAHSLTTQVINNHEKIVRSRGLDVDKGWGFKHPRTALMLHIIDQAYKPGFKYLHVIRDGRDSAYSFNKNMYEQLCTLLYHTYPDKAKDKERCPLSRSTRNQMNQAANDEISDPHVALWHSQRLAFWQDTNYQLLRYGLDNLGMVWDFGRGVYFGLDANNAG